MVQVERKHNKLLAVRHVDLTCCCCGPDFRQAGLVAQRLDPDFSHKMYVSTSLLSTCFGFRDNGGVLLGQTGSVGGS